MSIFVNKLRLDKNQLYDRAFIFYESMTMQ